MNQRVLQRFTLPNFRGQKKQCEICKVKFQLLVKQEHQCKRCLRSVCEQCGPERKIVYDPDGSSSTHRCCTFCIKQIQQINQYYTRYKLCFGQDSQFVSEWINRLNKDRINYDNILNQFSDNITSITNDNTIRFKRQSEAIINDLNDSYNYSFRNFVKVVTEGISPEMFQNKLKNVMIAIFARVKTLPYVPELVYLAVFFLCFANEAHTYFIITRLIQKIYPLYVHMKKMQKDKLLAGTFKTILQMYRICVEKVDRNQIEIIAQYLQARFSIYALSFTLNVCSLPCSFFIINQILKTGNCLAFYKGIAALLSYCREQLSFYKSFSEVEIPILRMVTNQKLKSCFIQFQKSDSKFEVTNEVFDSVQHRKLHQKYKQMQSLYTKSQKSVAEKQAKIKQILADFAIKKKQLELEVQKVKKLQLDLLKISHNIPKLMKYEQMSSIYEATLIRNKQLEQKCSQFEQQIEKLEKQNKNYDRYKRNWASMQNQYQKQLVQLRTKSQIMQIQVTAKQIDFNTSFIDKKIEDKNLEISILKQQIKLLKSQIEHYKLKALERNFNRVQSKINTKLEVSQNSSNEREKQFEKYIENSKKVVEKISKQFEEIKAKYQESLKKIQQLQRANQFLQKRIKEIEEVSKIIQETPQQYNYIQGIEQMERMIEKEINFIKKKTLESVKDSYIKCYKQLKFRVIDCRIKQQKIVNSPLMKLFNPQNFNDLPKPQQNSNQNLLSVLKMVQNSNNGGDKPKSQCPIM